MFYARSRADLSQSDVAQAIGIHPDSYRLLEKKADRISPIHLLRFCSTVKADPTFILYGQDPPPTVPLSGATIGQRIREYRKQTGFSVRRFSSRVLGSSRTNSVCSWESDSTIPELRSLMMISNAFGISAVSFLPFDCSAP